MVIQKNNTVFGDQAGGDIDKSTTHHHAAPSKTPETMVRLIEQFKQEYENNKTVTDFIDKLEHFKSSVDGDGKVIGLENKLVDGGLSDFVHCAREMKEAFFKKLTKYQFYESAQKIYVYVLADIYSKFHCHVQPLIIKGEPPEVVLDAVSKSIIDPLFDRLGENVLELYTDEINGALYFLTGNCHIKWVK